MMVHPENTIISSSRENRSVHCIGIWYRPQISYLLRILKIDTVKTSKWGFTKEDRDRSTRIRLCRLPMGLRNQQERKAKRTWSSPPTSSIRTLRNEEQRRSNNREVRTPQQIISAISSRTGERLTSLQDLQGSPSPAPARRLRWIALQ